MQFESNPAGKCALGLALAALRGQAGPGRGYFPVGEADLRPALYAPASSFPDFAAAALTALFPGELDPFLAERLAAAAFSLPPAAFPYGEELLLLDFAGGPSGSTADYGAALLAALLAEEGPGTERLLLSLAPRAEAGGAEAAEAAALAEALAGRGGKAGGFAHRLVILKPRGSKLRGIGPSLLASAGGPVLIIDLEGSREEAAALVGAAAGAELAGRPLTAAGAANPARFAARIVLHAAAFSLASRGSAGEILHAFPPGDGFGLAAALWGWRLGLPESGLLLAEPRGGSAGPGRGSELVERFGAENPGALRALVRGQAVDREEAAAAAAALAAAGGPELDAGSALALAAAERALEAGLRGQARLVVGREALPSWDAGAASAEPLPEPPADASIAPGLEELERALAGLLGGPAPDTRARKP
ncbi:MAG TPA: hypothetical protein P5142_05245 [Spirochaetia bacterium]|nr:hypothetical protein [Spirochaetia bacterium]